MKLLNDNENGVLAALSTAFNLFIELEVLHYVDQEEFSHAINAAQNIVMARAALRDQGIKRTEPDTRITAQE